MNLFRALPLIASLALPLGALAQTTVGGVSKAEFDKLNAEGSAKVAAVTPTKDPLSAADRKLMMQVAQGGMLQLHVSQAALPKVSHAEVKVLAQSEVEEQTGLSNKLKEIADAKGVTLPAEPPSAAKDIVAQLGKREGADLDAYYTKTSGVDNHVKLQETMTTVSRNAKDPALKALADATLPVIGMHLKVSRNVVGDLKKSKP